MSEGRLQGRSRLGAALRLILPLALMALAVGMNRTQIRQVLGHRPDVGLFALGFGFYIAGVLLAFSRWYLLVRALGLPFRPIDALRLGFIGTLFNMVIPGAIGGDFVKAAYFAGEQEQKTRAVATVVIDRLVGILGLFLLAALMGAWSWGALEPRVRRLVVSAWIGSTVVALLLAVAFTPALYRPLARLLAHRPRLGRMLHELVATGAAYRGRPGVVVLSVAMCLVTHLFNVLAWYSAGGAIFDDIPSLADHLLIVPLVLFSTGTPLPFNALGVSEQVSAGLFRLAHFRGGAVGMMAFRVLQFGGALIGGAVYLANQQQVRALRERARTLAEEEPEEPALMEPSAAPAAPGR